MACRPKPTSSSFCGLTRPGHHFQAVARLFLFAVQGSGNSVILSETKNLVHTASLREILRFAQNDDWPVNGYLSLLAEHVMLDV